MSIINSDLISDRNAIQTGEFRLLQGATAATQKLPLVEISIKSKIVTGKFLCCSNTQLPAGVDWTDICRDVENDDLTTCVVTMSMSAAADHSVIADRIQLSNMDHVEAVIDLDDLNLQSLFLDPTPIVSFDAINLKQNNEPRYRGYMFLSGW